MKLIDDISGNVEMIPQTIIIGITIFVLWVLTLTVSPSFQLIPAMTAIMDVNGTYYYDVETTFNTAKKLWYFLLIMITAVEFIHLILLAIKKQRYTGGDSYESDF